MTAYFTSDTHFCHHGIIGLCKRPFADVAEMNEAMVSRWNARVHRDDTVYILGDFVWGSKNLPEFAGRLKGRKVLVQGNHDTGLGKPENAALFRAVLPYLKLSLNGRTFICCHYPIAEWDGYHKGWIHLYGHTHSADSPASGFLAGKRAYNVCAGLNGFAPVSEGEIIARMDAVAADVVPAGE